MGSTSIRRQILRQFENGRGLDSAVPRLARENTISRAIIKVRLLGLAVFAAAFLARHIFFLDVRPVSWDYTPPQTWSLQAAFLLLTIENMAAVVAGIAVILLSALYIARLRRLRQSKAT
jgi:hypothetical protein